MPATVKQSQLVKLFLALGVDTATEWSLKRLKEKAEAGLKKFIPEGQEVADPELRKLYEEIEAANAEQDEITVVEDAVNAEGGKRIPDPKKPAAKPKAGPPAAPATANPAAPAKPAPKKPAAAKPEPAAKPKKRGGWQPGDPPLAFDLNRGPGVISSLVEFLKKANAEKPLTKAAAVEKLHAKFPTRDRLQLTTTVNNQMPSRLRIVRGIHLHKDGKGGYWIEGDGQTPQKNPPKPANAPPVPKPKAQPAAQAKATTPAKPAAKPAPAKKSAAKPASAKPAKPAAKKKPSK